MDPATPVPPPSALEVGARSTPRGCFGRFATFGLGCGAFLVGGVLAAALFAPSILAGAVAQLAERQLGGTIDGSVEVSSLTLDWSDEQLATLKLLDPDGSLVLEGKLRFPGVLMLDEPDEVFDLELELVQGELHGGPLGVANLARALGRGGTPWAGAQDFLRLGRFDPERGLDQEGAMKLRIEGGGLRWFPQGAEADGVLWHDLDLNIELEPSGAARAGGGFKVTQGTQEGRVTLNGRSTPPAEVPAAEEPATEHAAQLDAHLEAREIAPLVLTALLGETARLTGWLGGPASLDADLVGPWLAGGTAHAVLTCVAGKLELDAHLREGALVQEPGDTGLRGTWHLPAGWLEQVSQGELPRGLVLDEGETAPWAVSTHGFDVALEELWRTSGRALAGEHGGEFQLELSTPGDVALVDSSEGATLALLGAPEVSIAGHGDGELVLDVAGLLGPAVAAAERGDFRARMQLAADAASGPWSVDARTLPGVLLDHWLELDGLASELLGASVRLEATHDSAPRLVLADGTALESLEVVDGRARLGWGAPARLSAILGPALKRDLLTPLLPWFQDLESAAGAPVTLTFDSVEWPLSESLTQFTGRVTIELGHVRYHLHEGLARVLEVSGDAQACEGFLLPIAIEVASGRATYDLLTFGAGDEEVEFTGTFDFDRGQLSLSGEVPAVLLREQLGLPEQAGGLLAAEGRTVGVTLTGPWEAPEVSIPTEAIREFMGGGLNELLRSDAVQELIELLRGG